MSFCFKNSASLAFFLAVALALPACGSKQAPQPVLQLAEPQAPVDSELTKNELAALKTTGQIDRHVPEHAMPDIAAQYKYFLRKGRNTMCSFSRRSEQYLAYARKVFRERGMPEELANLAIIESGYRPDAVSHAGAAGAWQFMPQTGLAYGLKQDWWQDERLDPYKATEAAADYLQKLYKDFGDWPTAIAAYNAGEGKLLRAREGTGGSNFYEVNARNHLLDEKAQLKDETRQYVPRFIAVTKIMRNLPSLGFDPINPEAAPGVLRLTARPGTDLREFSKACNLSWSEFASLNQHHKRTITCTDRETFVYVPSHVKQQAQNYLCTAQKTNYAGWKPVTVGRKDSLEKISKRARVSVAQLQAANPGVNRLKAGQIILAPLTIRMPAAPSAVASAPVKAKDSAVAQSQVGRHTLKPKETLYAVARKYNVSLDALKGSNGISDPAKVKTGMSLTIPGKKAGKAAEKAQVKAVAGANGSLGKKKPRYTVQAKDSLWSIARKHNVTVADLERWNGGVAARLKPGASLVVAED